MIPLINTCIFEDAGYKDLYPLTYVRPAYDLLVGTSTLFEKIKPFYSGINITLHVRDHLKKTLKLRYRNYSINKVTAGSPCLFLNGRVIFDIDLYNILTEHISKEKDVLLTQKGNVVALYLHDQAIHNMKVLLDTIPSSADLIKYFRHTCITQELTEAKILAFPWDALNYNSAFISNEFKGAGNAGIIKGNIGVFSTLKHDHNIMIDDGCEIEDFVYLDASKGPIYISKNVYIGAHSRLEGPLYIGDNCHLKKVHISNSSIGDTCKISGEVSNCIFLRYSNKGHDGYLGDSYCGEWVNIGAMSTCSNLKNNYHSIRISTGSKEIDTKRTFLGAIIGDHVKLGIGSLLSTGSLIGFGSSLYGSHIHNRYTPPFTWGSHGAYTSHQKEAFLSTATQMMARRYKSLSDADKDLFSFLHDQIIHP